MDTDYAKPFREARERVETIIEPYLGRKVRIDGLLHRLVGCNDCGVLYWCIGNAKKQYTSGHTVADIDRLFNK